MSVTSQKSKRKKCVLLVLASLVLIPVLLIIIRLCISFYQYNKEPEQSLSRYCTIGNSAWEVQNPYVIFPENENVSTAESAHYLQKTCISPMFFIERQNLVYLECSYTEAQYQAEVGRLAELCGETNTETFALPAYVYYGFYPNGCCEYAILDEASLTIHYLSFQGSMLFKQYIPSQLHPNTNFYFGKADSAEEWDGGNF